MHAALLAELVQLCNVAESRSECACLPAVQRCLCSRTSHSLSAELDSSRVPPTRGSLHPFPLVTRHGLMIWQLLSSSSGGTSMVLTFSWLPRPGFSALALFPGRWLAASVFCAGTWTFSSPASCQPIINGRHWL